MATITAETAGIDEAHIRSVSEILEQERLAKEQAKEQTKASIKNVTNKAKSMYNKLENMSDNVDNIKNKLDSMSDIFGKDSELGLMFAALSNDIVSLKDDSKDVENNANEVESTLSGDDSKNNNEHSDSNTESDDKTKSTDSNEISSSKTTEVPVQNDMYVPPADVLDDVKTKVEASKASGLKGKLLKYTPEQMSNMSKDDLGNVIKSGFASDMKSSPVISYLKSQVGVAEAAAIAAPVVGVVKKVKKLPELAKPAVEFMDNALRIDASMFDANDYLVTSKDTSKLYESAVDFGDMFFDDKRQGDVDDEYVADHMTAEERQALRDAKFGKADANVDYNVDNDYGLSGPGGKF